MTQELQEHRAAWEDLEAVHYGPVWERDAFGSFILPEKTLGWDVLSFADEYLLQSDGPLAGTRWRPTAEQIRILLWWYAIDDDGNFLFRRGVLRRMKGWGKDPFLAIIAAVEMLGPCRFGGWDDEGNPIAVRENAAWVQIAAVSIFQTKNTMKVFPGLFSKLAIARFGIEVGKEQVQSPFGQIEAVTSSPRALEGGRPTFVIMNETHHWVPAQGGDEMGTVIDRNLAKRPGGGARSMQITNAHVPGQNSWAEGTYDSVQDIITGKSIASGIFYDSLESNPAIDVYCKDMPSSTEEERAAKIAERKRRITRCLEHARGDSVWLNIPRLLEEILDGQTPMASARRFYFNQVVAAEDAWVTKQDWERCSAPPGVAIEKGEQVVLGFDGSKTRDSTALVAIRVKDGLIQCLKVWERPRPPFDEGWEIDRVAVNDHVEWAFAQYNVVGFYSDVREWESYVDNWSMKYMNQLKIKASPSSFVGWDMRTKLGQSTQAAEALAARIETGEPGLYVPDKLLTRHILNARRRPNQYGISFGKENAGSYNKVDALAATVLAFMAWRDFRTKEKPEKKRYGFAW